MPTPLRRKTRQSAPLAAMEARSVDAIPRGGEWQYEPKWDGFRCLLSRDGEQGRACVRSPGEDLTRYFPELVEAALRLKATAFPARWRDRGAARQDVFVRRSAAANSSGGEPHQEIVAGDARAVSGVRPAGDGERQEALRATAQQAAAGAGSVCQNPVQVANHFRLSPATTELRDGAKMARAGRRRLRRRDRQAPRPALSVRQSRRHAEDQEFPQRRLRRRRLSLRHQQTGGKKVVGSLLLGLYDEAGCCIMSASPRPSSRRRSPR